jgi:hypothetical protein
MKKIFFIFNLFISFIASGETFVISQKPFEFLDYKDVLVANCLKKCEAKRLLDKHTKINLRKLRSKARFANSVGSDVCSLVYKGNSIIGLASNRDQRAFCVFKDESLIELNSLGLHLKEKGIVKE